VAAIRDMALWRRLRLPSFALLAVAVALTLVRANNQPGIDVHVGSTSATVVPGDVVLVALFIVAVITLIRRPPPRQVRLIVAAAFVFCALIVVTAAANGTTALVGATKFVELAALGLGGLALVREERDLEALVDVLLLFTIAADVIALEKFVSGGGGRQSSFLGEHDFAALATLPLLYGLVLVFDGKRTARAAVAVVAGATGCILGAALASLLGFYLGTAAVVVVVVVQRRLRRNSAIAAAVVVACVSAGTLTIRAGELGFLQSWFGKPPQRPGQYAASWSQRLIYTYVGFRVFVDHPVLGTGWYPLLPPKEFDRYLPAARKRFSDQPPRYFPPADRPFIPQQTFDQVPAELGVVGSLALLTLLAAAARGAVSAVRRTSVGVGWLAAAIGAIAGEALFGGTPLAATVWIVLGVCAACAAWPRVTT
jgi:hypothetical protein